MWCFKGFALFLCYTALFLQFFLWSLKTERILSHMHTRSLELSCLNRIESPGISRIKNNIIFFDGSVCFSSFWSTAVTQWMDEWILDDSIAMWYIILPECSGHQKEKKNTEKITNKLSFYFPRERCCSIMLVLPGLWLDGHYFVWCSF